MEQAFELAEKLQAKPDLFPWVCFVTLIALIFSQRKRIFAYIDARIDAYGAKKESDAVMAEVIRNNTAALENNTAALKAVEADRGETRRMLSYHENASRERMEHIQTVVNRIDETVTANEVGISVLKERRGK